MKQVCMWLLVATINIVCASNYEVDESDRIFLPEIYPPENFEKYQPPEPEPFFQLYEVSVGSGSGFGTLEKKNDRENFAVVPIFFRIGFSLNSLLGIEDHKGVLQFALEPFANAIVEPEQGIEFGIDFFLRYDYPVFEDILSVYAEVGAGPMYFGIDTEEQGAAGFNFLDQFGVGFLLFFQEDMAINVGYRFRHVSHAGLRGDDNSGVDAHSIVVALSLFY